VAAAAAAPGAVAPAADGTCSGESGDGRNGAQLEQQRSDAVNLQRITRMQVLIVGVSLLVGISAIFYLIFMRPMADRIDNMTKAAEASEAVAATKPQEEAKLAAAQEREQQVNAQWQEIMDTRMPKVDLSDPIAATLRMWDFPEEERKVIADWFDSSGAVVTGYGFPEWGRAMPSSFPNPEMVHFDPQNWNLTVTVKDFPALCEWLLKLPEAPRFMVMSTVTIQGPRQPGQSLVAQVPVTLWELTGLEPTGGGTATAAAGAGVSGGGGGGGGGRGRGRGRGPRQGDW